MKHSNIKIVIADDHGIFREGFKLLLKEQDVINLVGEAENGKELLQVVKDVQPDVVFVDIKMPVMDGIQACRNIKVNFPAVGMIALSMFNDDNLIIDMLEAGAKGYLLKNTNKEELIQATIAVYEGGTYYCGATSAKLQGMIAKSKFNPYRNQAAVKFTTRETDIIRMICQQLTNKEIAAILGLSYRTIETHRENIQEKIGAKNSIGVVLYAVKHQIFEI